MSVHQLRIGAANHPYLHRMVSKLKMVEGRRLMRSCLMGMVMDTRCYLTVSVRLATKTRMKCAVGTHLELFGRLSQLRFGAVVNVRILVDHYPRNALKGVTPGLLAAYRHYSLSEDHRAFVKD